LALFAMASRAATEGGDQENNEVEMGGSGVIVIAHHAGKSAIFTPTGNAYYYPDIPPDEEGGWSWRKFARDHYLWVLPSRTYMKTFDKEGEGIGSLKSKNKFLTKDKKDFPEMSFLEYLCLADQILLEKNK
jgi:hypothetical protein